MQIASPEPVDVALELHARSVKSGCQIGEQGWQPAGRVGSIEHCDLPDGLESSAHPIDRERPERPDLEQSDALSFRSELVDHVFHRAARRAKADDRALGVVQCVRLDHVVPTAGDRLELSGHVFECGEGGRHGCNLLMTHLVVVIRHSERTLRRGRTQIEQRKRDVVLADEPLDDPVAEQHDGLGRVRDGEAVLADEHRQQDVRMLGDPRRHHHQVVRFLRVFGKQLHDAGVAHEHAVGMIAMDVDRARKSTVPDRHHDRGAHRGRDVDDLGHQRKTL